MSSVSKYFSFPIPPRSSVVLINPAPTRKYLRRSNFSIFAICSPFTISHSPMSNTRRTGKSNTPIAGNCNAEYPNIASDRTWERSPDTESISLVRLATESLRTLCLPTFFPSSNDVIKFSSSALQVMKSRTMS
uniref:Uncharacterized protein n=1 Tax=Triticum urartu TaxID=4572 RepID=A0A8R7JV84_TRIUA